MWINSKCGSVVAGNVTKYPEFKHVGDTNRPLFKLSIAIGKDEQGEKKYADIAAWGRLAERLNELGLQKGDPVAAFGLWEKRDSKGKTYWTLNADFLIAYNGGGIVRATASSPAPGAQGSAEQDDGMDEFGDMPDFMK